MGKTPFGLGSKQFKIVQNCCEQTKTILVPCVSYRMEMLWWNIIGWKHTPICSISKATNQPTCADNPPKKKSLVAPDLAPKTCSQAARATPWRVAHGMAGLWLVWKFGTWFFRYSMFLVWKWHEMTKPGFEVDSYLTNLSLPQMPPSNRMFHIPPFSAEASKLQFFLQKQTGNPAQVWLPWWFHIIFLFCYGHISPELHSVQHHHPPRDASNIQLQGGGPGSAATAAPVSVLHRTIRRRRSHSSSRGR